MPPKRSSKASKQSAIAFYPTLNKPATAVGKYISAPGKFWNGCPAADKEKRFKCAVVEFSALHDYGDGVKGAGFSCARRWARTAAAASSRASRRAASS